MDERFAEAAALLAAYRERSDDGGCRYLDGELQYFRARITYQEGDFPTAMEQARQALDALVRHQDSVNITTVIQCMHLLAELHFDHQAYEDSTGIYQRWAASLITEDTPEPILAENQIGLALHQIENHAYSTQAAAARLGRTILDDLPQRYPDKYARLLVAEGLALKKYADNQPEFKREDLLNQACEIMTEAVDLYQAAGSIRWREAQREKIIILCRFGDRARFEQELARLTTPKAELPATGLQPSATPNFGFADRLRGYFHRQAGLYPDSVLYYYRRFQDQIPPFDFHLQDETYWTFIQYGLQEKDLDLVQRSIRAQLVLYRCCSKEEAGRPVVDLLKTLSPSYSCKYPLSDYGRLKLAEYRRGAATDALDDALLIFDYILQEWEDLFTTGEEETAIAQLKDITRKIIINANEAAWLAYRNRPDPGRADQMLRTLEKTKAFLLLKDRLWDSDDTDLTPSLDSLPHLQTQMNLLADLEMRTGQLNRSDRNQLIELQTRYRELNLSAQHAGAGIYGGKRDEPPSISELRQRSGRQQATIIFAEGEERLLAQYVDPDTVIVYATPSVDSLTADIDALLTMMGGGYRKVKVAEYQALARKLFDDVLGPVAGPLTRMNQLLVVPEGPLRSLPVDALVRDPAPDPADWGSLGFLARDLEVTYAPSLRLELLNRQRPVLNPASAKVGSWIHPELSGYFAEVEDKLSNAPAGSRIFDGAECRSATFRQDIRHFKIINIMVHAQGDRFSAYQNYLHFAKGDSLNGASVAELKCQADLVFLNACEGGVGGGAIGEGNFSIARSFQQIGVPHVVYSLWRIPAKASATVHARFYQYLFRGESISSSLVKAKRDLISGKEMSWYAFPGNWAGLVKG